MRITAKALTTVIVPHQLKSMSTTKELSVVLPSSIRVTQNALAHKNEDVE